MKRILLFVLVGVLVLGMFSGCGKTDEPPVEPEAAEPMPVESSGKGGMTPGTYDGTAWGMGGEVAVHVTVTEDHIDAIEVDRNYETAGWGLVAQKMMVDDILAYQTLVVDSISGATITSMAVKKAVESALKDAGADTQAWLNREDLPPQPEMPTELTADVVIVGGGGAGLAAAVAATDEGASVIVLEKMGLVGGNTMVCGGIYNAPDPELQEPEGIEDSPELFMEQTLHAGDDVADPELVRILTHEAYDGYLWLKSMGAPFEDKIGQGPGSLYPRTHISKKPLGTGIIDAYTDTLNARKDLCQILVNTKVEHLVLDDEGRVVGVEAKNKDDSTLTVHANKGVILATGGFAGNVELRQKYNTSGKWGDLGPDKPTTNVPGVTGDGILMAEEIDAGLVDMEHIQFLHTCNPDDGSITGIWKAGGAVKGNIYVNKEGKRFVKEDGRRDDITLAAQDQTDGMFYIVLSADIMPDASLETTLDGIPVADILANHMYGSVSADTLDGLAEELGMDPQVLSDTVDAYNDGIDKNEDEFGRVVDHEMKLVSGPWYAYPRKPSVHHTMGGVKINNEGRVLHSDGTVIPGLFAAGEVTGGIHGANRIGGNAVVDTVVFGRMAGHNAATME